MLPKLKKIIPIKSMLMMCLLPLSLIAALLMIVWLRLSQLLLRFLILCTVIVILILCVVVVKGEIAVHMLSRLMMNDINTKNRSVIVPTGFLFRSPLVVVCHRRLCRWLVCCLRLVVLMCCGRLRRNICRCSLCRILTRLR